MPACVMAGVVIVGDNDTLLESAVGWSSRFGKAEVEQLNGAVGA